MSHKQKGKVKVGDLAPDFTLPAQSGESVRLGDIIEKKKAIVLYFYPKDNTTGCTAEACAFRDSYEVFREKGAEVVGISSDTADSHRGFASKYSLPFTLLSDRDGSVRRLYGVPSTFGFLPGRVTYIIDMQGIVRHIFSSQVNPKKHIDEAIATLKEIHGDSEVTDDKHPGRQMNQ